MSHLTLVGNLHSMIFQLYQPWKEKPIIVPVFVYRNLLFNTYKKGLSILKVTIK